MTDQEHTPPTEAELDGWLYDERATFREKRLIREVRRLRALEAVSQAENFHAEGLLAVGNELLTLRAENARLRAERSADSERLDWLDGLGFVDNGHYKRWHLDSPVYDVKCTLREAIDAARQESTPRSTWRTKGTSCENCGRGLMDHENQLYCPTEPTPNCPRCHHLWSKHVSGGECAVRVDSAYTHDNTRPCGCKAQEPTP